MGLSEERDIVIEAATDAISGVIRRYSHISPERRSKVVHAAYRAVTREGCWPPIRRVRLWRALSEAGGLESAA